MTRHAHHAHADAMSTSSISWGSRMATTHLMVLPRRRNVRRALTLASLVLALLTVVAARASAQEVIEYYATDAVGSIRVVFDPSGNVKARSDYLPFGEEWQAATPGGPLPTQRFTGQQRDAEEGLDNFNARSYATRMGRMTTVDPVFSGTYEPQRWNRYAYALNNPLSYSDPTGLDPIRFRDYTEVVGGGGGGFGVTLDTLFISLIYGPSTSGPRVGDGGGGRRPRMGIDEKGNVTRSEEVTVTPEGDGDNSLEGSEIPACPNCIPYTGAPDKFLSTDDFVSGFVNAGGLSLGGVFKVGSGFVAKGAFSRILSISPRLAQKGFGKHGSALGLTGNWNPSRAAEFSAAVNKHINHPVVQVIEGRYRGIDVTHYLDPRTGVNVIADRAGNYISVWRLGAEQLESVLKTGRLF
jgi:RHS repeat-associated protein